MQCEEKTFLQSWNWGEFNIKMGQKIWRFGVYKNNNLVSVALIVKVIAKRGTFLFVPHLIENQRALSVLTNTLKEIAKEEKASFIRISPLWAKTEQNVKVFKDAGFRQSPMHSSAYEATWKLNITEAEDQLLKNMRKTTRYLIRKESENKDISIEKSNDAKSIEIYQKLNKDVSKRQRFSPFSDKFIKNEFEVFDRDEQALFIFGKHKDEIAAGSLVIFWSGIAFYHQAASLSKFAKYSIPYLMQWEAIKEAEKRGCKIYDFWGFVDPGKYPKHPWAGPTLFKMGFGGYKKEYVKTQDLIISNKYWINYIIEVARKLNRGL